MHRLTTKSKSLKLAKFNFAIPLMAFAGLGALGIAAINQDVDLNASASNSSALTGTISYGEQYITISNSSVIDLGNAEVTADSSYIYATDNVTVSTNVPTGYDLYISAGNKENSALTTPSSYTTIPTTSGTGGDSGTPKVLDRNTYGYAVPSNLIGNTNFDASYTSPSSTSKWAGVPAGSSDRIRSTSNAVIDGETTDVHYAAHVTNALAPGKYTGTVTYSAVATPTDNDIEMSVSPDRGIIGDVLTITSGPTNIATDALLDPSEVQIEFRQNGKTVGICAVASVDVSNGFLVSTCTVPPISGGTYDIVVVLQRYGFIDTAVNAYTSAATPLRITMQDMTTAACSDLDVYDDSIGDVTTYSIVDARNNNRYSIRKLADNHCWMVQNLRLLDIDITFSDSDVSSSFTIPASTNTYNSSSTDPDVWCGASSTGCINKPLAYYNGDTTYGVYYNWYTATAGSGVYASTGTVNYSICPKGWKLPKGDSSDYSWYKLFTTSYSSDADSFKAATNTGPEFYGGIYANGELPSWSFGKEGVWQSRSASSSNKSLVSLLVVQSGISPAHTTYTGKYSGIPVRCVFVGS